MTTFPLAAGADTPASPGVQIVCGVIGVTVAIYIIQTKRKQSRFKLVDKINYYLAYGFLLFTIILIVGGFVRLA